MILLIGFIVVVVGILYYVFSIRFEVGDGFSERTRDVEFEVLPPREENKKEPGEARLLEGEDKNKSTTK